MNEISKYWVRIPVGSNEEHREKYIEDYISLFPENEEEKISKQWFAFKRAGILQIVFDIRTGEAVLSMVSTQLGTKWDISNKLLKSIKGIQEFEYPEIGDIEDMGMATSKEMGYSEYAISKKNGANANTYDVDALLDIISIDGYNALSSPQKDFLKNLKK